MFVCLFVAFLLLGLKNLNDVYLHFYDFIYDELGVTSKKDQLVFLR